MSPLSSSSLYSKRLEASTAGNEGGKFFGGQHFTPDYPDGGMGVDPSLDMPAGTGASVALGNRTGNRGLGGAPAWNPFQGSTLEVKSPLHHFAQL